MQTNPNVKNGVIQILSNNLTVKNIKFKMKNIAYQIAYKDHITIHCITAYILPDNT